MESSDSCYVDKKLYPHLLLIPAVIIVTVLAFLNKRRGFKKDVWGGRPGLVIPLDFLGLDHDRLAISAIFGASAGFIFNVVFYHLQQSSDSNWVKAFGAIGYALEVAVLCFPLFACLTTEYKLTGAIMGLLYCLMFFILYMVDTFDKCKVSAGDHLLIILQNIPLIACYLFVIGKYVFVLYLKARKPLYPWTEENKQETPKGDFTKPWLIKYVKDVLESRHRMPEENWVRFLRLIYSSRSNFCFSTQTVSTVVVCSILLYMFTVELVHYGRLLIEAKRDSALEMQFLTICDVSIVSAFGGALVASAFLVAVVCVFSILRFMECHKNTMLQMFKGDTSSIPKGFRKSQLMVGRCLKYSGYHIAYFAWGYLLLFFIFFILTIIIAFISHCEFAYRAFMWILLSIVPFWLVTLIILVVLLASSMTIFRDRYFKKDVIALNNRNVYLVFSYFFFFLSLPMGFFSAILRVLKAMPVALFMLPRVDKCLMLDGFQRFDNGFAAYVSYLHVQAAHRNPVLRVFCQIVHNEMCNTRQSTDGTLRTSKKYCNKWLLLVTLLRNPQLQGCRKHVIAPPVVRFVNDVQVSVEVTNFEGKMSPFA